MAVKAVLIGAIETGVGIVSAKAYGATTEQAAAFSTVNGLVAILLQCLVDSYIQNTRQLILGHIAIQATSGLAGFLMTHLICNEAMHWKQALVSSVFSNTSVVYACTFLKKPVRIEFKND
jgi:thiamine transporter ThiT